MLFPYILIVVSDISNNNDFVFKISRQKIPKHIRINNGQPLSLDKVF